tara:strand:+ start:210 stop:380 length:171 start_codon:yes stop_codon:yes gene_type:complete
MQELLTLDNIVLGVGGITFLVLAGFYAKHLYEIRNEKFEDTSVTDFNNPIIPPKIY